MKKLHMEFKNDEGGEVTVDLDDPNDKETIDAIKAVYPVSEGWYLVSEKIVTTRPKQTIPDFPSFLGWLLLGHFVGTMFVTAVRLINVN